MNTKNNVVYIILPILMFALLLAILAGPRETYALSYATVPSAISDEKINILSSYQKIKTVSPPAFSVPTVVEVSFDNEFVGRYDFVIVDLETNIFQPHFFETTHGEIPISVTSNRTSGSNDAMIDGNSRSFTEFELPEENQGKATITIKSQVPVMSSSLTVLLDNHVALPTSVEIRANVSGKDKIIVAKKKMTSTTVQFPKTSSDTWTVTLTFAQPLRISELRLSEENATKVDSQSLRFLAQPDQSYDIYFNPDRYVGAKTVESGNLSRDEDVLKVDGGVSRNNPNYVKADVDGDSVPDTDDNCVSVENVDQADANQNGRGDACDDHDRDGLINSKDNCPDHPNRNQRDEDGDGVGDICDGVESRLTERYVWIPWVGIGIAVVVLVFLFTRTAMSMKKEDGVDENNTENNDGENNPPQQ